MEHAIFTAFHRWINQSPNLDQADYGGRTPAGFAAYWSELRGIRKEQTRARKALRQAREFEYNEQAMTDALQHSFSGRLTWNGERFEYCTGQYFPTEFAPAAATVLEAYVNKVRPKFTPTEEQRGQWWDISDIERANYNAGFHWFDASTTRFFRSRVLKTVYQGKGGVFFVSSEKGPHGERRFTIRKFNPMTADISTFGPFNELSRDRAQRLAKIAAEYPEAALEALVA